MREKRQEGLEGKVVGERNNKAEAKIEERKKRTEKVIYKTKQRKKGKTKEEEICVVKTCGRTEQHILARALSSNERKRSF